MAFFPGSARRPRRRDTPSGAVTRAPYSRRVTAAGVALGAVLAGGLVFRGTSAAFTDSTQNSGNSWAAGSVNITDDDGGAALFTATNLVPGDTQTRCLTVTYTGNVTVSVKTYGTGLSDTSNVAPYLNLTIEEGSGGGFGSCSGFASSATAYSGTVADFATNHATPATGTGTWAPTSSASKVYRITCAVSASIPNDRQGASMSITFNWIAQT